MMINETKVCVVCGEDFQIFHKVQRQKKYCSGLCSDNKWQLRKAKYAKKKK